MPKETKSQKISRMLQDNGSIIQPSTSNKYTKLSIPNKPDYFYFVGKNGALRVGKIASKSISLTHRIKAVIKGF